MPSLFFKWTPASLVHLLQLRVVAPPMVVSSNKRACPNARRPRSGAAQLVSGLSSLVSEPQTDETGADGRR